MPGNTVTVTIPWLLFDLVAVGLSCIVVVLASQWQTRLFYALLVAWFSAMACFQWLGGGS